MLLKKLITSLNQKKKVSKVDPSDLANSGIYSESDLEKLREHINFPLEKPALLNSLARGMTGKSTVNQGGTLLNLFNQEEIEQLAESAWLRLWQKFIRFGTVSAGIIAVLMILQLLKMFIDAMIRCYTLHSIFGWSIHLLGACFASITQLLLTLGRPEEPEIREMELIERQPLVQSFPSPQMYSKFPQEHPTAPAEKPSLPEGYHSLGISRN